MSEHGSPTWNSQSNSVLSFRGYSPEDAGRRGGTGWWCQLEGCDQGDLRAKGFEGVLCRTEYWLFESRAHDQVSLYGHVREQADRFSISFATWQLMKRVMEI
jgi:hypothetical protein